MIVLQCQERDIFVGSEEPFVCICYLLTNAMGLGVPLCYACNADEVSSALLVETN